MREKCRHWKTPFFKEFTWANFSSLVICYYKNLINNTEKNCNFSDPLIIIFALRCLDFQSFPTAQKNRGHRNYIFTQ